MVVVAAAAFGAVRSASSPVDDTSPKAAAAPALVSGMRVSIDPATGLPAPAPAKGLPDPAAAALFDSSHAGLVEERGTTRAGGFKVNAQGRFHSSAAVEIGQDGKLKMHCVAGSAEAQAAGTTPLATHP